MKAKDIKVGMKVVPHSKTVKNYYSLESCIYWQEVKDNEHPYLFIVGYCKKRRCWILNIDPSKINDGNFYNSKDFTLYKEI